METIGSQLQNISHIWDTGSYWIYKPWGIPSYIEPYQAMMNTWLCYEACRDSLHLLRAPRGGEIPRLISDCRGLYYLVQWG